MLQKNVRRLILISFSAMCLAFIYYDTGVILQRAKLRSQIHLRSQEASNNMNIHNSSHSYGRRSTVPQNTALNKSCYKYENLQAVNLCSKLRNYTTEDVRVCAVGEVEALKKRPYWVFYGNSRIRYLFDIISDDIINSPHKVEKSGKQILRFSPSPPRRAVHTNTYTTLPIKVTMFYDRMIEDFTERIKHWLESPDDRPTRLHIGFGVNHIQQNLKQYRKKGPEGGAAAYKFALTENIPLLNQLTKYTEITWWTIDYLLMPQVWDQYKKVYARPNINYYNMLLREQLRGTNITIMDAHVPLGELYIKSCEANFVKDGERCMDHVHQGRTCYKQYAMMFLNHACNRYTDPS